MLRQSICGFAALVILTVFASPAKAEDPTLIGKYGDWLAYEFTENGDKVCYMASEPKKDEGDYTRRGEIFALITHRPAEGSKNVFSYIAGYPYKSGSDVTVRVNGKTFTLFTQDETAWTPSQDSDTSLTNAVRRGSNMVVKGTSARGTLTTDTYSLKGSAAAYDAITQACGM